MQHNLRGKAFMKTEQSLFFRKDNQTVDRVMVHVVVDPFVHCMPFLQIISHDEVKADCPPSFARDGRRRPS